MAVEKNETTVEEELKATDPENNETEEELEVSVEGEEPEEEVRHQDDFNANLAEEMDERT